jgi:hypothetical protein
MNENCGKMTYTGMMDRGFFLYATAVKFLFMQKFLNYAFLYIHSLEYNITCSTPFLTKINGRSHLL